MNKYKIIAIGEKDGLYNNRKEFIGKIFIPTPNKKSNFININKNWYMAIGEVSNKLGTSNYCFYRIQLEKIIMKKPVGVISPYKRLFDIWVHKNKKKNESYIWINKIDDIRGREFSRIEKTDRYYEIENFYDLNKVALQRIR